jgi:stage II sporulation protein D
VAVPEVHVGVVVGAPSVTVGGGGALALSAPGGIALALVPAGAQATISAAREGVVIRVPGSATLLAPSVEVSPPDSGGVRLNGREYRGRFVVSPSASGLIAANVLDLESYLGGVVGAELGRRNESDLEALRAQAVVSRSVALRFLGRWRDRGYDLVATVSDQAYAGIGFEYPLATLAVAQTRGEILTFNGTLIDAFFHSTCGGTTEEGSAVFAWAGRPYLRSIRDVDEQGRAWCAISPRFRWQERWTGEALARTLRETLPPSGGPAALAGELRDIRILERTGTGRVARIEVAGRRTSHVVTGAVARNLFRTGDGSSLRSARFSVQLTREGERIVQLVIEGGGAGHGVGMCQWGAIGRARAGFSYHDILSAYFPGTEVTRHY